MACHMIITWHVTHTMTTRLSHDFILQYHVLTMDELRVQVCNGGGQKSCLGDQGETEGH